MAQRLTDEEKKLIRQMYGQCGVYAVVARIVGCSPSTVAKCVKEAEEGEGIRRCGGDQGSALDPPEALPLDSA